MCLLRQCVCEAPSSDDLANLDLLEKHALVCYTRLKRTAAAAAQLLDKQQEAPALSPISKHLNNNSSILKLCGNDTLMAALLTICQY